MGPLPLGKSHCTSDSQVSEERVTISCGVSLWADCTAGRPGFLKEGPLLQHEDRNHSPQWDGINAPILGFSYIVSFSSHNSVSLSPSHRWGQRLCYLSRSRSLGTALTWGIRECTPQAHYHAEEARRVGRGYCRRR